MSDTIQKRALSKAQLKHLGQLRTEAQQAQASLLRYVDYLADEHEIDKDGSWQLGADSFERKPTPNGDSAQGQGEDAQAESDTRL